MWKTIVHMVVLAIYVFYCVAAGFSIHQSWKLMEDTYYLDSDDGTLYVPLTVCEPEDSVVAVNGTTVPFDTGVVAASGSTCHNLKYLIYACSVSLVFSIVAMAIYSILSILVQCNRGGQFNKSSVLGMGLFLTFILLQAAICLWCLASECKFWTDYFTDVYVNSASPLPPGGSNSNSNSTSSNSNSTTPVSDVPDVQRVSTYGNIMYFWVTAGLALFCTLLLLLTAMIQFCTNSSNKMTDKQQQQQEDDVGNRNRNNSGKLDDTTSKHQLALDDESPSSSGPISPPSISTVHTASLGHSNSAEGCNSPEIMTQQMSERPPWVTSP